MKDITVHLDGSSEDEIRLEYGQALASGEGAHLIGIFTNLMPDLTIAMPIDGGAAVIEILSALEERSRQEGDAIEKRLALRLASIQIPSQLRRYDETYFHLAAKVTDDARCSDLFLATRPFGSGDSPVWDELVEAVLFGSGRAILLLPPKRRPRAAIETVLIAWNGSLEAVRALRDGMSLIERARRTILLMIDPETGAQPWLKVKSHLEHHGVTPEIVVEHSHGRRIADVIMDEADARSADIIIMGGYGHTRLRERVFGGATADVLREAKLPLLMAH